MKSYIGYSTNSDIRYKATSGGIGTTIIKWLFDNKLIGTSISFEFDPITLRYVPKIIHSFDEYQICGSIYQEIDLIGFVKSHQNEIKGTLACFALPCQTKAIKSICERYGHKVFIIGLTCSSQQTLDATKYLLKRINIKEQNVCHIQYRGNGWPSGITIKTKDNKKTFIANNASIWNRIFHSRLFIRPKCFMCKDTLNQHSDIALADPWLKEYISSEKIGMTLATCFSETGNRILTQAQNDNYIHTNEISWQQVILSQKSTLDRKESDRHHPDRIKLFRRLCTKSWYRFLVLDIGLLSLHCKIKNCFEKTMLLKEKRK